MTDQVVIDWQTFLYVLQDIDVEKTNPFNSKGCGYTVGEDHCLIGEIFTVLGVEMPPINHPDNHQRLRALVQEGERWDHIVFEDHVILTLLCLAQSYADDASQDYKWIEALETAAYCNEYARFVILNALEDGIFDLEEMREF